MNDFFNNNFNIPKIMREKREYREYMSRAEALPEDYRFVFKKIQNHMWQFAAGDGYDMMKLHYDLIELFEEGAAEGRQVLEITGEDVAAFCDELLLSARTYTEDWRKKMNSEIHSKLGKRGEPK